MTKKNVTQISFEVDPEIHKKIKIRASIRGMKMREYILQALAEKMTKEEQYQDKEK